MRFTIDQQQKKREIKGDFHICATRADFERLIEQIKEALETSPEGQRWAYGWVTIREVEHETQSRGPASPWVE